MGMWRERARLVAVVLLMAGLRARTVVITERGMPASRATWALLSTRTSKRCSSISAVEQSGVGYSTSSYCSINVESNSTISLSGRERTGLLMSARHDRALAGRPTWIVWDEGV